MARSRDERDDDVLHTARKVTAVAAPPGPAVNVFREPVPSMNRPIDILFFSYGSGPTGFEASVTGI
jgi:hypothetical protein